LRGTTHEPVTNERDRMNGFEVRRKFRELLGAKGTIVAPGCFDVLSARLAASVGFAAVYLGGYVVGKRLGVSEPLTTLTEMARESAYIARQISVPLIVDGNAGFGDPLHTMRTVWEFEAAGVSAIHIEDQVYPKRAHYHAGIKYIISEREMCDKIKAAVSARRDADFSIIARTDAREAENGGGVAGTIERARKYLDAGADIIMPYSTTVPSKEEAADVIEAVGAPVLLVASEGKVGYPSLTVSDYEEIGCKIVIFNLSAYLASFNAVKTVFKRLYEKGGTFFDTNEMAGVRSEVEALTGLPEHYKIEESTGKK